MDKPGSWFLLPKYMKNTRCFKHFGSKNQLPSFYISQTLAENGLIAKNDDELHLLNNWLTEVRQALFPARTTLKLYIISTSGNSVNRI